MSADMSSWARACSSIVVTVAVAGCGGVTAERPATEQPRAIASTGVGEGPQLPAQPSSTAQAASPPESAPVSLPAVTVGWPEKAACDLEDRDLALKVGLALDAGGAPYVALDGSAKAIRAALPIGASPRAWGLDATVDGVTLRGHAPLAEVPLGLRAGVVHGDLYVPDDRVEVHAVSGESGTMTTTVTPFEELELLGAPLSGTASCAAYGLTSKAFEPRATIYSPAGETAFLVGDRIPISIAERGAVRGHLRPSKGPTRAVEVIGAGKRRKRIAWTVTHGVVFGWVPAGAVSLKDLDEASEFGGLGLSGMGPGGLPEVVVCKHPVGLRVAVGERREVVGVVQAETPLLPSSAASPGFSVTFASDAISPKNGAIFYVDASEVADCSLR